MWYDHLTFTLLFPDSLSYIYEDSSFSILVWKYDHNEFIIPMWFQIFQSSSSVADKVCLPSWCKNVYHQSFPRQLVLVVFSWSLSDSRSYKVSGLFPIDSAFDVQFLYLFFSLWRSFQVHQLRLVPLPPSCSTAFSFLKQGASTCLVFFLPSLSLCGLFEQQNLLDKFFSFN